MNLSRRLEKVALAKCNQNYREACQYIERQTDRYTQRAYRNPIYWDVVSAYDYALYNLQYWMSVRHELDQGCFMDSSEE